MLVKWRLLCTRTNGVACPCIGVVRLIVGVRCIERPLIEVPLYYYRCLLEMTCQLANVLKTQCDVKKGDAVIVYMPTSPMAVAAMFACARIGAVHWYVKLCTHVYIQSVNA